MNHPSTDPALRPEEQLVLHCAQALDTAHAAQLRQRITTDIDWTYTIRVARRHGVMPLLFMHLQAVGFEGLPLPVVQRLRDVFQHNARRNLFLSGELLKLLRLLNAHEVPAVPFKGPVLAISAYHDLALRQFSDLDLLVPQRDVLRVKALLQQHGYSAQPQGYPLQLTPSQEAAYVWSQCNYNFMSANDAVVVEVHWKFAPHYFVLPYHMDGVWQRLGSVTLAGTTVPSLGAEDLLVFLCAHGAKHGWERLAWICDVAQLLRTHPDLDWDVVLHQAQVTGSKRMLVLGICLAHTLQSLELPASIVSSIDSDPTIPALTRQVWHHLFQGMDEPPADDALFQLFHLQARERWRDRIRYCMGWALLPTVNDWAVVRLPPPLDVLYYGLRPFRLLSMYGPRFFKRSMKE